MDPVQIDADVGALGLSHAGSDAHGHLRSEKAAPITGASTSRVV
jgi:hypothetical protein